MFLVIDGIWQISPAFQDVDAVAVLQENIGIIDGLN